MDHNQNQQARMIDLGQREVTMDGTITRQLHYEAHAVAGEVNLAGRECTSCGLLNIISPTTRQCGYCDPTFKTRVLVPFV
jgi:hypothetical protein